MTVAPRDREVAAGARLLAAAPLAAPRCYRVVQAEAPARTSRVQVVRRVLIRRMLRYRFKTVAVPRV
jgi:hypothetical protein